MVTASEMDKLTASKPNRANRKQTEEITWWAPAYVTVLIALVQYSSVHEVEY